MKKIFTFVLIIFLILGTTHTTIIIDGTNDFESDEDVPGTSGSTYFITWDSDYLYVGAQNDNVDDGSSTKFIYFYIDSDPQLTPTSGTGSTVGITYNTQQPGLPFTANYHFRWKNDNSYSNLQMYSGSSWIDGVQTGIQVSQSGTFVEFRIPRSNIGLPSQIYFAGAMIDEQVGAEWTYYLMPSNQSDGYDRDINSYFGFNLIAGISPDNAGNINALLPVELTTFTALAQQKEVKLNWQTATEVNNYGFEIERKNVTQIASNQTNNWEKIGFIEGHGNSNSPKTYAYKDNTVKSGKYNYRLKQIDIDGSFEYSAVLEAVVETPNKLELSQNYPNPFNPTTSISFSLNEATNVSLSIFNVIGEKVVELINQKMEAGFHTTEFDASDLNSGIYIYRLQTEKNTLTKKMTILK